MDPIITKRTTVKERLVTECSESLATCSVHVVIILSVREGRDTSASKQAVRG